VHNAVCVAVELRALAKLLGERLSRAHSADEDDACLSPGPRFDIYRVPRPLRQDLGIFGLLLLLGISGLLLLLGIFGLP
jgi:hypothetical protein